MSEEIKLTRREISVILALEKIANRWPSSLWIFSSGEELCIMRLNEDSERAMTQSGGVDQEYMVASISIPSDGGAW